jgi:hypothetical protein
MALSWVDSPTFIFAIPGPTPLWVKVASHRWLPIGCPFTPEGIALAGFVEKPRFACNQGFSKSHHRVG